ncbi:hypothetical protein GCM10010389_62840 [Streptomyces echinoruber]|uniref:Uncharacterized protein n=1 Tax=Streptomyces echinoruber TaxID=68898 RepID=A0A918VPZ7_9ACTN|nr:hypothetical protein GCM10010389_62840 [Streptomyces echinoruber]
MPGWSFSNSLPRVVKLSFSEAAAKTVTVPESRFAPEAALAAVPDAAADPEDRGADDDASPEEEQALRASSAAAPAPAACSVRPVRRTVRVVTGHPSCHGRGPAVRR